MTSVHQQLVDHLRDCTASRAVVRDVSTAGAEEVQLLLDVDGGADPLQGRLTLHLLLIARSPLFWLSETHRKKPLPPTGFGHWLKAKIEGLRITGVSSGDSGRILKLEFGGEAASAIGRFTLTLDPLTNGCRVLTLTTGGEVEQRFPAPVHASASGRGAPGAVYEEPAGDFDESWQTWLAPVPIEREAPSQKLQIYFNHNADGSVRNPAGQPLILAPAGDLKPIADGITLFGPPAAPLEAARAVGRSLIAAERRWLITKALGQAVKAERKHLKRLNNRLTTEIVESQGGESLRRQAEALLANPGVVPKGADYCELPNPSAPTETIAIDLNPALGFAANANKMFKKAGKLERALDQRQDKQQRLTTLLIELDALDEVLSDPIAFDPAASPFPIELPHLKAAIDTIRKPVALLDPGLTKRRGALGDRLAAIYKSLNQPQEQVGFESRRSGMPDRDGSRRGPDRGRLSDSEKPAGWGATDAAAERAGIHPRRFILPAGWVVLVGRTNTENDTLTHRAARQKDLWFHARGVAGSHVVLQRGDRKDNPSRETLQQAAAIAAYHSKAKTSGLAPVVYTEKRYVRKPRKAPPGLAVCIREKVLMVKPALPETSAPDSD